MSDPLSAAADKPAKPDPIARLEALPEGEPVALDAVVDGSAESLILLRQGDAVRAWLNICPHAGRRLDWSPGKFLRSKDGLLVCAAHGASFELAHGACVAGPCRGQSMRAVQLRIADGEVHVAAPQAVASARTAENAR